jgi:hypothetical protein
MAAVTSLKVRALLIASLNIVLTSVPMPRYYKDIQVDRQTADGQTDRQTDRHTDI